MSSAVVGSKIGSMLLMVVAGLVGAFIPLFLRKFKMHTAMNLSNAFAGGAFLALGVFHILPDAIKELDEAKVYIYIGNISYNLAYILVFIGYIVILFCESVLFDPSLNEAMSHRDSDSQETSLSGAVISHKCNNLNAERKKEEMYYNKDVEKNDCALVRDSNSSNFENSCIRPVEEKKGDIYVDNNKNDISINVLNDNKYNRSDNWNKDCKNVEQKLKEENIIIEKEISNRNGFNQADFIKVEMDNTTIRTASSSSSNNLILKMEENRTNQVNRKKKKKINKILSVFSSASFFLMIALAIHGFFKV